MAVTAAGAFSANQTKSATTAKGFNAHSAGSGIEIDEARTFNAGAESSAAENVEQRLAQAVAGGARGHASGGLEDARTKLSCNDSHLR